MKREDRKHAWTRVLSIFRQADRLEKQVAEAPPEYEEAATARYQTETTKNQIELFDRLDALLAESNYKKGKRQWANKTANPNRNSL